MTRPTPTAPAPVRELDPLERAVAYAIREALRLRRERRTMPDVRKPAA